MDDYEMTELAMRCVGMDTKDLDLAIYEHMDELDRRLDERWGIDMATFEGIAEALLYFTPTMLAPLSNKRMHLFGEYEKSGEVFRAMVRVEARDEEYTE